MRGENLILQIAQWFLSVDWDKVRESVQEWVDSKEAKDPRYDPESYDIDKEV